MEAWEFIVGGGASFNHLNGLFTVQNPAGRSPENDRILGALRGLTSFIYSFDFLKMSPDKGFIAGGVPSGAYYRGMSQPGHQYALYLHHSKGGRGSAYTVTPGNYTDRLVLKLPAGTCQVDWVAPETGSVIRTDTSTHKGGYRTVETPAYSVDIALRIKRVS